MNKEQFNDIRNMFFCSTMFLMSLIMISIGIFCPLSFESWEKKAISIVCMVSFIALLYFTMFKEGKK